MAKGKKNANGNQHQADPEYPETVMFPPPPPGQEQKKRQPGGQAEEYPETVMFPPRGPPAAAADDGYPETVMFPPRGPPAATADDGYPETVMFPPRGPPAAAAADDGYPETVMFPPRGPAADKENPSTVQFPPRRPPEKSRPAAPAPANSYHPAGVLPHRPPTQAPPFNLQAPQPRPPRPHVVPGTPPQFVAGNPWSTGLFDCDQDPTNAVMAAFLPCVTFGQIAEIMDQGQTSCSLGGIMYALLMPILSCALVGTTYRTRMRQMYNLQQAPAEDWLLHTFCPCCALSQEYRELQHRGYDPSQGWMGNVAMQQGATPPRMTPPMHR